jgi:hypothetical protein
MYSIDELGGLYSAPTPEIIIGTETWLNDSVHNSEIFPPNYNIYRRDRRDGFGGVLIAVKADIVNDHLGSLK